MFLVKPELGLIFWTSLVFLLLLFLLSKFAWKPILQALAEREKKIADSLELAERTKREMETVKNSNEKLLQEARLEREKILKEASELKENIISQAKKSAEEEARKVISAAKDAIEKEKNQAMSEIKASAADIGIQIAERILKKKLENQREQSEIINQYLEQLN